MIYFDNAATTGKKPTQVIKAVNFALNNLCANPGRSGHTPSVNASMAVYKTREKVASFFGALGPESVIFTKNCTESLNYVIKGVLEKNDHIIISNLEHNAVMRPLKKMGITYDVAKSEEDDDETIENFRKNIKPNTKMIISTSASNVTGKILPIKKIGELCKRKGILFAVDAAQSAGVLPINIKDFNIDYLCISPHKGLYAPMGIGILIAQKPINHTVIEGGTGTDSIDFMQPLHIPEGFESGTINLPAICGVSAGLDYINQHGIDKLYNHEIMLIKRIYDQISKMPTIELYTKRPEVGKCVPVLSFNVKNVSSVEMAEYLNKKGIAVRAGLHCAPTAHASIGTLEKGTIRVCTSAYNTQWEIDYLVKILKSYKKH